MTAAAAAADSSAEVRAAAPFFRRRAVGASAAAAALCGVCWAAGCAAEEVEDGAESVDLLMERQLSADAPVAVRLRRELLGQAPMKSPGQSWAVQQLLPNKRGLQQLYPPWMEGRWAVRASFLGGSTPLGRRFVGPATPGSRKGSIVLLADAGLPAPEEYEQRFLRSELEGGVVADRAFNVPSVLLAFWPEVEVTRCEYDPATNPTRLSLDFTTPPRRPATEGLGGVEAGPGSTRVRRAVELFINNREGGYEGRQESFICAEFYRQSALEQATAYDYKTLLSLARRTDEEVTARLRVGSLLNPRDELYFEAAERAVAVFDYAMTYRRVDA